jgi:hypothetical protein
MGADGDEAKMDGITQGAQPIMDSGSEAGRSGDDDQAMRLENAHLQSAAWRPRHHADIHIRPNGDSSQRMRAVTSRRPARCGGRVKSQRS